MGNGEAVLARPVRAWRRALVAAALVGLGAAMPGGASGEQSSSEAQRITSGYLDAGGSHACVLLDHGRVRCWGSGGGGELGYGNTNSIGDNETPGAFGPVDLAGEVATRGPTELEARATPRRDRTAPFKFKVSGDLSGPFAADETVCRGEVKLTAKEGTQAAGSATAPVKLKGGSCTYSKQLTANRDGRLTITARFTGTSNLAPASDDVTARAG